MLRFFDEDFWKKNVIFEGSQSLRALQPFNKLSGFDSRLFKNSVMPLGLIHTNQCSLCIGWCELNLVNQNVRWNNEIY
jgi:hypothetical protein